MPEQFLTCKFKIHNPSKHKRDVIDFALEKYTLAYARLLDWARENEDFLREHGKYKDRFTDKSIGALLPRPEAQLHSSAKDSLIRDVAGNLASYFALAEVDPRTSFPTCRDPDPDAISGALDEFAYVGASLDDYNQSRDKLLKLARGSVMPLYFSRADGASQTSRSGVRNRNFSLLSRADKRQLLAVLYLLPKGHQLCRPLNADGANLARLDTGEVFVSSSKSAIIVPLEIGRSGWQDHRFLEPAMSGKASVKTAFLVRHDDTGEYFLHVSFSFPCPERYDPEAYLGIDKGILFTAAYAIVNEEGAVVQLGHFDDDLRALQIKHGRERERLARNGKRVTWRHYERQAYDNILHRLANRLIDMASGHKAQIVVEDLNIQTRGSRVISRFRKLDKILSYKCKLAGVPYRSVFAAYSSQICHHCGEKMRRDDRLVQCDNCGYTGHSDDNAAVNIARRAMYRKSDWSKNGGYWAFHRSFANVSTLQTENDLRTG